MISPSRKAWPCIWQTWIPSNQGCFVPSLFEIGSVFWRTRCFKYFKYYFTFSLLSPLGKGRGPSFEQTFRIPFTQKRFVPGLVRRRFLNFINVFSLFRKYLPLEKGGALHLNKLEFISPKDHLCQVWLILVQWLWRRRWKCAKFTTTTTTRTTTTENRQIVIRKALLSLWLRWAKISSPKNNFLKDINVCL